MDNYSNRQEVTNVMNIQSILKLHSPPLLEKGKEKKRKEKKRKEKKRKEKKRKEKKRKEN
jgi:hypothetical protein